MEADFWWAMIYLLSLATVVVVALHVNTDDED